MRKLRTGRVDGGGGPGRSGRRCRCRGSLVVVNGGGGEVMNER